MDWQEKTASGLRDRERGLAPWFKAVKKRFFSAQEEQAPSMKEEIERARARCRAAEERFLSISDPEMTDYAVYEMEAACRQYAYLVRLRQSKEALSAQKETQGDVHAAETVVK